MEKLKDDQFMDSVKPIIDVVIDFLNVHWVEIDLQKAEITKSKSNFIFGIMNNYTDICWVFTEIMAWGCKNNYFQQYKVECEKFLVVKIKDKYFKYVLDDYIFVPVMPKTKTVVYFD